MRLKLLLGCSSMCNFVLNIFLLLGLMIAPYSVLSAGPVYAAQWKKGGHVVCLYGDRHDTHLLFGQAKDKELREKFLQSLKNSKDEILFLLEEYVLGSPYEMLFKAVYSMFPSMIEANNGFLRLLHKRMLCSDKQNDLPHVQTKNVDLRGDWAISRDMLCLHKSIQDSSTENVGSQLLQKMHELIGAMRFSAIYLKPIGIINEMINNGVDTEVGIILSRIKKSMIQRLGVLKEALEENGFESLETLTLSELCDKTSIELKGDDQETCKRYKRLCEVFTDLTTLDYFCDIIEACALWHIAQASKTNKKVVVLLGDAHVAKIETYLEEMGYEKNKQEGLVSRIHSKQNDDLRSDLLGKWVEWLEGEGIPLKGDSKDSFCLELHRTLHRHKANNINTDNINTEKFDKERFAIYEKMELLQCSETEKNQLIPCETFQWISESLVPLRTLSDFGITY